MISDLLTDKVGALMRQNRYEDAWVLFREEGNALPPRQRRLVSAALKTRLAGHSDLRRPLYLVALVLVINLLADGFLQLQVQDFFSFLARSFRPYMYLAALLPVALNLVLIFSLLRVCYTDIIFPSRLRGERFPLLRAGGFWALCAALLLWSTLTAVPLARDLPLVLEGRWPVAVLTEEELNEKLLARAWATRGVPIPEGMDVTPWFTHQLWPDWAEGIAPGPYNRWACEITVDGVTCPLGRIQFDMTDFQDLVYPIVVEYLPNSRIVLWIDCGEEAVP